MTRINKNILISLFLVSTLTFLNACKELDEALADFEDENGDPTAGMMDDPHMGGHDHHDATHMMPGSANLKSISINKQAMEIDVSQTAEPWRVMNNSVLSTEADTFETIEIALENRGDSDSYLGHMEIRLQSVVDHQSLMVMMSGLNFVNGNIQIDEHAWVDVFYEDMMMGMFHGLHNQNVFDAGFIQFEGNSIILNIAGILTAMANDGNGKGNVIIHDHPVSDPAMSMNTDIASRFHANDLYSVRLYTEAEMFYGNTQIQNLSNCVYASADSPPADIKDICQAYLSIF